MSDLRFASGHRAAVMAGLVGVMVAPLIATAPAKAANITKTLEWYDGEPTRDFSQTIVENGVTYQLVSQSDPVAQEAATHTFRAQTETSTVTREAGRQWPDVVNHPETLFPQTKNVNEGGMSGTLVLGSVTAGSVTSIPSGQRVTVHGTSEASIRAQIPSTATNVSAIIDKGDGLWEASYTASVSAGESITFTANYPSMTVQVGRKKWTRTGTYQSVDNANNAAQQQQLQDAQRQAEAERARQEEAERERQRQEEAQRQAAQAKTVEEAKTQSNQLINDVERMVSGSDSQYISEDTKTQAQGAIEQLRQALNSNDLVNINTAQGSLRQISDRMTQEITVAKGEAPSEPEKTTTPADDTGKKTSDEDPEDEIPGKTPIDPTQGTDIDDDDSEKEPVNIVPIAAGIVGLVAAGGVITGVVVAKSRKKQEPEQQPQAFDENGNPIDPAMAAAMGGMAAGGAVAVGTADAMATGEEAEAQPQFVSAIVVPPAEDELENLALIPGYVPVTDSQCQLFAYLSDEENKSVLTTGATISPADDIPTLVEIPITEEDDPFVAAWVEEDGSYRLATDENGEVIYQLDENGQPLVDEEGNPVPEILIPDYILVLPAEDVEKAVSQELLVYSDDGQEIFRGEIGEYTMVDTGILWGVINEQIPEEERTDIIDEISVYVERLDSIDENNDAASASYEAERQSLIEAQEQEYAEWQAAQEAAMAQASTSADDFNMTAYQDAGLAAMSDYGMDATDFEDVTDGIDEFGQPGMEYDPMGVTGDGFNMGMQQPYYGDQGDGSLGAESIGNGFGDDGFDEFDQTQDGFQPDGIPGYGFQDTDGFQGEQFGEMSDGDFDDFESFDDDGDQLGDGDDFGDDFGDGSNEDDFGDEDDFGGSSEPVAMPAYGDDGFEDFGPQGDFTDFDDFESFDDEDDQPAPAGGGNQGGDQSFGDTDAFFAEPLSDDDFDDFDDFEDFDDMDETDDAETAETAEAEEPKPAPRIKIPERKRNRNRNNA